MSVTTTKNIYETLEKVNRVSPSFCLAKWHHVNIYLHTGQTHSCYHPPPKIIPLDELSSNPSALHNTLEKKKERALMLRGEKPKGCQYCWNIEALGGNHISDRMIRNNSIYQEQRMNEIRGNPWDFNINPEYIEIAFSNECNFKCGYCHPKSSSSLNAEIKMHGPYTMVKNHRLDIDWFKTYEEDNNPYLDAWWKWWPEVSKTLNILRITGGEPLMHKSTWRLFEMLSEEPKPRLELNLNSNLGLSTKFVERLSHSVNDLIENRKIRKFMLFSSMDSWGDRAEYLRTGLKLDLWERNLESYILSTKQEVSIMCTFNILSVTSFTEFLKKVLQWRSTLQPALNPEGRARKIWFDTPYLKEPLQYDMMILPKTEYLPYFDRILDFMRENTDDSNPEKFTDVEFEKFRRVRDYFATVDYSEERVREGRKDFYHWFSEYDRRRGTNFLKTFPEMASFFKTCQLVSEK